MRRKVAYRNAQATKIQARFRARKGREHAQGIREQHDAVSKIGAVYRGRAQRVMLGKQNDAAVRIQSSFRGNRERMELRMEQENERRYSAAVNLQVGAWMCWRDVLGTSIVLPFLPLTLLLRLLWNSGLQEEMPPERKPRRCAA